VFLGLIVLIVWIEQMLFKQKYALDKLNKLLNILDNKIFSPNLLSKTCINNSILKLLNISKYKKRKKQ
jgi:hypothetical protein